MKKPNGGFLMPLRRLLGIVLIALLATLYAGASRADSDDHNAARGAVERGEIRPLAEILAASIRDKIPGEIAGVEIERKAGRWLYEFRVVGAKGRLFEVYVDARTGGIDRVKEK
jgi:uncharacterized membrane protein YkoI